MKNMKWFLVLIAVLGLLAIAPKAEAQLTPLREYTMLSNTITIGTASTNLTSTQRGIATLTQGKGCSVVIYGAGTQSTNTGVGSVQFSVSTDGGTTFTTTKPIQAGYTMTGTTAFREWVYFDPLDLSAATHLRCDTVTNILANQLTGSITNITVYVPN